MSSYLVELAYDRATPVVYRDDLGRVPTSAALYVEGPTGTVLESPACSVSSTSTTVSGSTATEDVVPLTSVSGLSVGDRIAVAESGVTQTATIGKIVSSTVYLTAALSQAPGAGAQVKRLAVTASVAALGLSAIGSGYRLRWRLSTSSETWEAVQTAAVVRWVWSDAATSSGVREWIAQRFGSTVTDGQAQEIARRVNDRIRTGLAVLGRRPHLYPSHEAMREAAFAGMAVVAIDFGFSDRSDPQYQYGCERRLGQRLDELRSSAVDYDDGDSGDTSARSRCVISVRARR